MSEDILLTEKEIEQIYMSEVKYISEDDLRGARAVAQAAVRGVVRWLGVRYKAQDKEGITFWISAADWEGLCKAVGIGGAKCQI